MEVIYAPQAIDDINYWKRSGNKAIQKKIEQLILAIQANPFEGIGKPEQLRHELAGSWSRRINREHRIIYEVYENDNIVILEIQSVRGHY